MFTDEQVQEVQEHIRQEMQMLVKQALDYKNLATNAKTQTKRKYFLDKLEKVNGEVAKRVITLQKIDDRQAAAKGTRNAPSEDQAV